LARVGFCEPVLAPLACEGPMNLIYVYVISKKNRERK
jgi:hypothetical protein